MIDFKKKELDIKQIFDVSLSIYKQNFVSILGYLLVMSIIAWFLGQLFVSVGISGLSLLPDETLNFLLQEGFDIRVFESFGILAVIPTSVLVFTNMADFYFCQKPYKKKEFFRSYKKIFKYFVSGFLHFLVILPIFLLTIVAIAFSVNYLMLIMSIITATIIIVYLLISFGFYINIIAHTGSWGITSLIKSRTLINGRFGKACLINFISIALVIMSMEILGFFITNVMGLQGPVANFLLDFITLYLLESYLTLSYSVWFVSRHYTVHGYHETNDNRVNETDQAENL